MRLTDGEIKKRFLVQFSDEELLQLLRAFEEVYGGIVIPCPDVLRRDFPWRKVLGYTLVTLTGSFDGKGYESSMVLDHIDGIKEWAKTNSPKIQAKPVLIQEPAPKNPVPEMIIDFPQGLEIHHQEIGAVRVTQHAWKQFCERFAGKNLSKEILVERLRKWFQAARVLTNLRPKMRVRRIIASKFKKARYLYNDGPNARFVLAEDENVLLTVEYAYEW